MIGQLKGRIDEIGEDWVLLDVAGVGYEIACPSRILARLPGVGEAATLSIETYVREDAIRLYGFSNMAEREWFRRLMTVQGVGAKVALAVLGVLDGDGLGNAILMEDKTSIQRAPGVGKRVAERIVAELKGKVPSLGSTLAASPAAQSEAESASPDPSITRDAVSALMNLGYAEAQVRPIIARLVKNSDEVPEVSTLIRQGLRELAG